MAEKCPGISTGCMSIKANDSLKQRHPRMPVCIRGNFYVLRFLQHPEVFQKFPFRFLKSRKSEDRTGLQLRFVRLQPGIHQRHKLMVEHVIINREYLAVFFFRKSPTQEFMPNHFLQRLLDFQIFWQFLFHRTGHIGQICLAGIMEQTGQLNPPGISPCGSLPGAVHRVLTYGIKAPEMAVGTAKHTQGMGNVPDIHQFRLWIQRVKHNAGVGFNAAHRITFRFYFTLFSGPRQSILPKFALADSEILRGDLSRRQGLVL